MKKFDTLDCEAMGYDQIKELVRKILDNDFFIYFQNQPISKYNCNCLEDKAEVVYDIMIGNPCYSLDNKLIYIQSHLNAYGTYAMENLLSESDMYTDKEDF